MGGSGPAQYTGENTASMLNALEKYAPAALRAMADTAPYTAQKTMDINRTIAPQEAALQNEVYAKYGPEANRIGSEIAAANQLRAREADVAAIAGPGRDLVGQADELQQIVDPEAYKSRAIVGSALEKFLATYDPSQLSPTELSQIERGIGREGPVTPSAMNTIKNAARYGDAATKRWQNFGNAVAMASSALPNLKSGINAFEVATGRPLTSNSGDARLSTPQQVSPTSAMDTNFGFANNTLNQIGANQRSQIAKQKDTMDMVLQGTQAFGNVMSGVGSMF